jgi:hypothetical protein
MNEHERSEFEAMVKEAGRQVDPETAEVFWIWGPMLNPYGIYPYLPEVDGHVGALQFVRSPGSDVWVHSGDLPEATRNALRDKSDDNDDLPWE